MKKWLALTAALLCLTSSLTGCGKDDGKVDSSSTTEVGTVTEAITVTEELTTENSTNTSTDGGVIDDIMTDAEDMVDDIVTDAGDIVDDIIPDESESTRTETTE